MNNLKLSRKFDKQAKVYNMENKAKILGPWRKRLIGAAKGDVLELAVGAGGNLPYYPSDVHVTAVDISPEMLHRAKKVAVDEQVETTFILGNNEELIFKKNTFDTVVSTLSFCGYENRLEMLNKINAWCKPDGKILLLEHGISESRLLAKFQRWIDPLHVKIIGCHQTMDFERLLQESDIECIKSESHFKNIFKMVWARPSADTEEDRW